MAYVAPCARTSLGAAGLALVVAVAGGCASLPRLTLGATSSLRSRQDGAITASRWTLGATLGWDAHSDRDEPGDLMAESILWRDSARAGAGCAVAALCRWELAARSEALLSADTLLQGVQ